MAVRGMDAPADLTSHDPAIQMTCSVTQQMYSMSFPPKTYMLIRKHNTHFKQQKVVLYVQNVDSFPID